MLQQNQKLHKMHKKEWMDGIKTMRLVDADALKAWFLRPYSNEETYSNIDICSRINSAPTVDPVKHGWWMIKTYPGIVGKCACCSVCGYENCYEEIFALSDSGYSYCPGCGAKMDEVAE